MRQMLALQQPVRLSSTLSNSRVCHPGCQVEEGLLSVFA